MTRRVKNQTILHDKPLEKADFKRKENVKKQLLSIIIACEGLKTERNYFESIIKKLRTEQRITSTSRLQIVAHQHTNPTGVLDDLLAYQDRLGNTYKQFEEKWIVIDRDEERTNGGGHTLQDFNKAIQNAEKKGISVAYSNPSFEIWYLLHFHFYNTSIDRDSVIRKLEECLQSKYNKSDLEMFSRLAHLIDEAIRNAERLDNYRIEMGWTESDANPSTKVYQLVKKLLKESESV